MTGSFESPFEEAFFHVGEVSGSVEDAEVGFAELDLFVHDFEAFFVADVDYDVFAGDGGGGFVAGFHVFHEFEFENGSVAGEHGAHDESDVESAEGLLGDFGIFHAGFEGESEDVVAFFGGDFVVFVLGEVGVDEVFGGVVDVIDLLGEFHGAREGAVEVAEVFGGAAVFFVGGAGLSVEVFGGVFAADEFEEEDVVFGEFLVEGLVVCEVADVDGAEEGDVDLVFGVGGDGGLEASGGVVLVDADEVGGGGCGGCWVRGEEGGKGEEEAEEAFHFE